MNTNSAATENLKRVILVTIRLHNNPRGGRELLCKLMHDALKETYGDRLVVFELPKHQLTGMKSVSNAFKGHLEGLNEGVS